MEGQDTARISFEIDGETRQFSVPVGQVTVLQAALNNGIHIDHACGGVGMCSTCRVVVKDGMDNLPERNQAEETFEILGENRMSCQCTINGDVSVEVPVE